MVPSLDWLNYQCAMAEFRWQPAGTADFGALPAVHAPCSTHARCLTATAQRDLHLASAKLQVGMIPTSVGRPNAELSVEERQHKKHLKRALKQAQRSERAQRRAVNATVWSQPGPRAQVSVVQDGVTTGTVALKDDMGRVFAHAPADIVGTLRRRLGSFMQSFLDEPVYTASRAQQQAKALELLDKMKKGRQIAADFGDEGALWGYAKYKWMSRAMLTCEAFRQAQQLNFLSPKLLLQLRTEGCTVASVGGGPGNDLFGLELCRQLILRNGDGDGDGNSDASGTRSSRQAEPDRRFVFDFAAAEWAPLVKKAAGLLGCAAKCLRCDLSLPLGHDVNTELRQLAPVTMVFLFSYILQEVGTLACWRACFASLWEMAPTGALFYVKDPNDRTAHQVLQLLDAVRRGWQHGVDYCWVCGGVLLLCKPGANSEVGQVRKEELVDARSNSSDNSGWLQLIAR
eukprot:SAG31_NODE_43_length_31224_cov_10.112578_3_plen_457_part_00